MALIIGIIDIAEFRVHDERKLRSMQVKVYLKVASLYTMGHCYLAIIKWSKIIKDLSQFFNSEKTMDV